MLAILFPVMGPKIQGSQCSEENKLLSSFAFSAYNQTHIGGNKDVLDLQDPDEKDICDQIEHRAPLLVLKS